MQGKEAEVAHELWRHVLQDETVVAEISPGVLQCTQSVAVAGKIGEPFTVFRGRLLAHALDVLHHGEPQCVGVHAVVVLVLEFRLEHNRGVRVHEFQHRAFGQLPAVVHAVHNFVVHPCGAPFVHDLRLALGIEILCQHANDAQQFALPVFELRRMLLEEIEHVLLRQPERCTFLQGCAAIGVRCEAWQSGARYCAPDLVIRGLLVFAPLIGLIALLRNRRPLGWMTADTLVHQRMSAVEHRFDGLDTVLFLALGHVLLGEGQIVEDRGGIGPLFEQVIVLEEVIVPHGGVRHYKRLHRHGIFFHDVVDAGIGIYHQLISERPAALTVHALFTREMFAERPVPIHVRHAD